MTRSVEIPDEAVVAAAKAVSLDYQNYLASMRIALAAALPYLAPAERPVLDRAAARRAIYTALFGSPEGTYDNVEVALDAVMALARTEAEVKAEAQREAAGAPAGDGGLREALEKLKRYCSTYVDGDGSEDEQLAYDDIHIQLSQLLDKHPAAPAPVVGVCEHPSDIFGPCTLLQGHELHGYLHQNTKGEKWSNFGEPAHTAQPAAPAVPQPVEREALAKALHEYDKYDAWDDEGCNDTGTEQRQFTSCKQSYLERADIVLALVSSSCT